MRLDDTRLPARFWDKVLPEPNTGCWLWTAALSVDGYGIIRYEGQTRQSHRVAYETLVSPVPDGLQLDHRCRQRSCANPAHLEPVTKEENHRRGLGSAQPVCRRGHPRSPENLRVEANGVRRCRPCDAIRQRRCKARAHP